MRVHLDYGSDGLDVEVPDERTTVIEPALTSRALADPAAALRAALRAPIGRRAAARRWCGPGQRVAISVCDITRAQPRRLMLGRCSRSCRASPPRTSRS